MPSYAKCRVAELRQICEMRVINYDGLRKPELIDALSSYDNDNYRYDDDDDNDGRLDVDVESQSQMRTVFWKAMVMEMYYTGTMDAIWGILAISLVLHRWLAVLDTDLKGKWSWSCRLKESVSKL